MVSGAQLPLELQARAATAYSLEPSAAASSEGFPAAELLDTFLLGWGDKLTTNNVVGLISASPSLGPESQPFDPALTSALQAWLEKLQYGLEGIPGGGGAQPWFAAALMQLRLQEAAQGDQELAGLLVGAGAVQEEYLR